MLEDDEQQCTAVAAERASKTLWVKQANMTRAS